MSTILQEANPQTYALRRAYGLVSQDVLLNGFRTSNPPQNRQLIVYHCSLKYEVDGFVGELTF